MSGPTNLLIVGMAGSGKTTFTKAGNPPYMINLDPAVLECPFKVDEDIRDTVNYKEVMEKYKLGPNGAIMTCLNLFTVQFENVLSSLSGSSAKFAIIDTPGQIEIFTWSASGSIITETLASEYPTMIIYIIDTARCTNPTTFMSNMLYACSILYKTKLPFIIVFNKIDETPHEFAIEWMTDFEAFHVALNQQREDQENEGGFMTGFVHSMSLVLEEFYNNLKFVGVSSMTGEGMDSFLQAVEQAKIEYETEYKPEMEMMIHAKKSQNLEKAQEDVTKMAKDLKISKD